jgi:hypothetical protein
VKADQILASAEYLKASILPGNTIARKIAFGVHSIENEAKEAWLVVQYAEDAVETVEVHLVEGVVNPDDQFDAYITMAASAEVWLQISEGGIDAALHACDKRQVLIGGKLPYFIRNVRSAIEAAIQYAAALKAAAVG